MIWSIEDWDHCRRRVLMRDPWTRRLLTSFRHERGHLDVFVLETHRRPWQVVELDITEGRLIGSRYSRKNLYSPFWFHLVSERRLPFETQGT